MHLLQELNVDTVWCPDRAPYQTAYMHQENVQNIVIYTHNTVVRPALHTGENGTI